MTRNTRYARRNTKRGFTVIEVLMIVVIVGILSAAVLPRLMKGGLYSKYVTYTAVHRIASDMRLTRRLSITNRDSYRLRCYKTGGSGDYNAYDIEKDNSGSWDQVGESHTIPDDIIVSGDDEAEFNSDGTAEDDYEFKYKIGSYKYRIKVKDTTGRIKFEAY